MVFIVVKTCFKSIISFDNMKVLIFCEFVLKIAVHVLLWLFWDLTP